MYFITHEIEDWFEGHNLLTMMEGYEKSKIIFDQKWLNHLIFP